MVATVRAPQTRHRADDHHAHVGDAIPREKVVVEATLTERYQTTIPAFVRKALNLSKHDKIQFVLKDGRVELQRETVQEDEDPALRGFLALLERDIAENPQRLQAVDAGMLDRIDRLTRDVEIDLDAPLDPVDD